jgi:hypothetical protein
MSGSVTVMVTFRSEEETVQTLVLAHRPDTIEPPGKHFVDVTLVADVEDKLVPRRFEDAVKGNRQFDDAEVRPEVTPGLGKHLDELVAHFLRELGQVLFVQGLDIGWRTDSI